MVGTYSNTSLPPKGQYSESPKKLDSRHLRIQKTHGARALRPPASNSLEEVKIGESQIKPARSSVSSRLSFLDGLGWCDEYGKVVIAQKKIQMAPKKSAGAMHRSTLRRAGAMQLLSGGERSYRHGLGPMEGEVFPERQPGAKASLEPRNPKGVLTPHFLKEFFSEETN